MKIVCKECREELDYKIEPAFGSEIPETAVVHACENCEEEMEMEDSLGEIDRLCIEAHEIARDRGWYDDGKVRTVGELIALCHSELSEALEEYRNNPKDLEHRMEDDKPEGFIIELADLLIRVFDMVEFLGLDLHEAIELKMLYNRSRPHRHGNKAI